MLRMDLLQVLSSWDISVNSARFVFAGFAQLRCEMRMDLDWALLHAAVSLAEGVGDKTSQKCVQANRNTHEFDPKLQMFEDIQ